MKHPSQEQRRRWNHTYTQTHREQERLRKQRQRLSAKVRTREVLYSLAWQAAHPAEMTARYRRRRARKRQAPVIDLSTAQWLEIQVAFSHRCAYCGKRCKGKLTQDHVTPYAHNGAHTLWNVVPACASCNSHKHAGPVPVAVQPLLLTLAPAKVTRPLPTREDEGERSVSPRAGRYAGVCDAPVPAV